MSQRQLPDHPARNLQVEQWLDSRGVKWEFVEAIPCSEVNWSLSLATQARSTPIIEDRVVSMQAAIADGQTMPARVVWKAEAVGETGYVHMDGNNRGEADRRDGRLTFPAYVVDAPPRVCRMMALRANDGNGSGRTKLDIERQVLYAMKEKLASTAKEAAEALGLREAEVRKIVDTMRATERADATKMRSTFAALPPSVQASLAGCKGGDEVFKELLTRTSEPKLRMTGDRVVTIMREMNRQNSDSKRLAVLDDEIQKYRTETGNGLVLPRKSGSSGGGRGTFTPFNRFQGWTAGIAGTKKEEILAEIKGSPETQASMRKAVKVLQDLLKSL